MTQKLEDLLDSFTSKNFEEQITKIKEIRSARNIERPAAAVKRVKKVRAKSTTAVTKSRALLNKLTPEQKVALLKLLTEAKK